MSTNTGPSGSVLHSAQGAPGRLWFIGGFPPPLNGQSNANKAMHDHLADAGVPLGVHDIGSGAGKIVRTLRAALALLVRAKRDDRAYLSVPGQLGVWLFVPIALALRMRGVEHFIHHHSFRPINLGPLRGMRALVRAGGARQSHILLSQQMSRRFAALYFSQAPDRALTLSNAYLFGPQAKLHARPPRPFTLGHMSVLTKEKGVAYLLDLFDALADRHPGWRLVIAGPCHDADLAARLEQAVARHGGRVDYRGSVSGGEKDRFLADIDLFVLPTTLIDEAEPLVMLEAYASGVDVVATDTGCIRDRVRSPDHLLSRQPGQDAALIAARADELEQDWAGQRMACVEHARAIKREADREAARVLPRLANGLAGFAIHATPMT